MDGDGSGFLFGDREELEEDVFGRAGAVSEVKLVMVNSTFFELRAVVGLIVEAHDSRNSHFFEDGDVVFGGKVGGLG